MSNINYPSHLFTLKISTRDAGMIIINAVESSKNYVGSSHTRIDVEVRQAGNVVFPLGALYCGIPSGHSIDGKYAKETVLSLVGMKYGDTDYEYFRSYTASQIQWAEINGEMIDMVRQYRYCDENGNLR